MVTVIIATLLFSRAVFQAKYKEAGKKQASSSLYHQLPETLETKHAKEAYELRSQVRSLKPSPRPTGLPCRIQMGWRVTVD